MNLYYNKVLLIVIILFNIFGAWYWLSDPRTAKVSAIFCKKYY